MADKFGACYDDFYKNILTAYDEISKTPYNETLDNAMLGIAEAVAGMQDAWDEMIDRTLLLSDLAKKTNAISQDIIRHLKAKIARAQA